MHETVRFTILLVLETLRFTILLVLETVMIWSLVCSRVMCMFIEGRGLRTAASVDQNRSSACLCLHARINPNVVRSFVRSFVRFFFEREVFCDREVLAVFGHIISDSWGFSIQV